MTLDPRLGEQLRETYEHLHSSGELVPRDRLKQYHATFRDRFGPDRLQSLDGELLLETMHNSSNYDSLVYWLEFKNDEEFPTILFGSIAGGSALKFGIYRRKETGAWMAGTPLHQRELSLDEAVQIARKHRDQFVRGAELLDALPVGGSDGDYRKLQEELKQSAPDLVDTAWGHKYFYLLYPDKLEDFHAISYQRFNLVKLLQLPPEGYGRYLAAGRFVAAANELSIPLNHLTEVLGHINGNPYRYWRIGTRFENADCWPQMRDASCVAIGWPELGDLSRLTYNRESKTRLGELIDARYSDTSSVLRPTTQQVFNFVTVIGENDLVLPSNGRRVLGIGRVVGDYLFDADQPAPHCLPVRWLSLEEWDLPTGEGLAATVHEIKRHAQNLVETERRILYAPPVPDLPLGPPAQGHRPPRTSVRLEGTAGRIQAVLERKKQVILYGPPGTGKTYWALAAARDLASYASFGQPFSDLSDDQRRVVTGDEQAGLVRMCTFHPAYGYEDFIEGYRPDEVNGQLVFERKDGVFKCLCDEASQNPDLRFYLIVDEINRGDIPRIFGELLTLLEADKRGQRVLLPVSGRSFSVPGNVFLIGTMNTADRSIALLDTALRRRFGFIELMPDSAVLGDTTVAKAVPLGPWLDALNSRVLEHIGRDARNLQIGHAYLLHDGEPVSDWGRFVRIVEEDILALLQEYCYEDYDALEKILGSGLVDANQQRIRHELFEPARRDDLIQALLAPSPELSASPQALASEAGDLDENDQEEPEQDTDEGAAL